MMLEECFHQCCGVVALWRCKCSNVVALWRAVSHRGRTEVENDLPVKNLLVCLKLWYRFFTGGGEIANVGRSLQMDSLL